MSENSKTNSYYSERMRSLGINDEANKIRVTDRDGNIYNSHFFQEHKEGIQINYFSPSGMVCKYENSTGKKLLDFHRVRKEAPNPNKYTQPTGSGIVPFITPSIIRKTKEEKEIQTLIITEGEFKAFAGDMAGMDIIGVGGINNFCEKDKKDLHHYLKDVITQRKVKNVVLLFDADCISENYVKENIEKDLHSRLFSFYIAVKKFREYCKEFNIDVYFSQVKSEFEMNAKGLDDLLITFKNKKKEILADIYKLEKSSEYFFTLNVTDNSLNKLYNYFLLKVDYKEGPKDFYERFQAIIDEREFIFNKITYQLEKGKLCIKKHPDAMNYIRVKTDFYLRGHTITSKCEIIDELYLWKSGIIKQDYGHVPRFINMIPKYISFVNVPDNTENYKQTIEGCYNLYEKIRYKPKSGEIINSLNFLKHIFQDKIEIGLDYLTVLYKFPTHALPVLCLVSEGNNTGKSSFLKWLNEIFGNNAIILGNKDFESNFNSHWASKLIIGIDESFIDKRIIKEKIKHQSTEANINLEAKGRDIVKMSWIGKFILCSNDEANFIQADKEDQRFFVLKIPVIPESAYKLDYLEILKSEIPSFLNFLQNREITHPRTGRMWFNNKEYETDAFRKTVRNSRHVIEKAMIGYFSDIFDSTEDIFEIRFIPKLLGDKIKEEIKFFKGLVNAEIERILKDKWGLLPLEKPMKFDFPYINYYNDEQSIEYHRTTGRFYTIDREFINNLKNN